jgi:acyl-lipid omega-6 desaturase (Delta-12 desaturase)
MARDRDALCPRQSPARRDAAFKYGAAVSAPYGGADLWCEDPLLANVAACPAGGFLLVRLFAIQHDCGHGSFFASRFANDLLGRAIGLVTLTPYAFWRGSHAVHHASSGNLNRRGTGDITMLTVREYRALSPLRRLLYRAYRHPLVLFGLGPLYLFVVKNHVPIANPFRHWKSWSSILGTNAALAAIVVLMVLTAGTHAFVLTYLPVILLAASIGIWLFYIQHQFEHAYWASAPNWDFHEAALKGSSFYDLPVVLHWLTGYIGFHHIHHMSTPVGFQASVAE